MQAPDAPAFTAQSHYPRALVGTRLVRLAARLRAFAARRADRPDDLIRYPEREAAALREFERHKTDVIVMHHCL
jgi:hypothetical protein